MIYKFKLIKADFVPFCWSKRGHGVIARPKENDILRGTGLAKTKDHTILGQTFSFSPGFDIFWWFSSSQAASMLFKGNTDIQRQNIEGLWNSTQLLNLCTYIYGFWKFKLIRLGVCPCYYQNLTYHNPLPLLLCLISTSLEVLFKMAAILPRQ